MKITGKTFHAGEHVVIDGVTFEDCTFEANSVWVYRGGELPVMRRCTMSALDTVLLLEGAAGNTVQFLTKLWSDGPQMLARAVLRKIAPDLIDKYDFTTTN